MLTGSKQQIAQKVADLEGDVREAIAFIEEPVNLRSTGDANAAEDIFAEMEPYTVRVGDVDDSREALYTRWNGEWRD